MTGERIFYSDANGIRIGTVSVVFGGYTYRTRDVSSVTIMRESRRQWPGIMIMIVGAFLLAGGVITSDGTLSIMGGVGFLSGSFYFSRKRPKFMVRMTTNKGPVLVLASFRQAYVEQVRQAINRSIEEFRSEGEQAGAST